MLAEQKIQPSPLLQPFVLEYCYKEIRAPQERVFQSYNDQFLEFYLQGRYLVSDVNRHIQFPAWDAVLMGVQTARNYEIIVNGFFSMLSVRFAPLGFYQLFGMPLNELTDLATEACLLAGRELQQLHETLSASASPATMVDLIEHYLLKKLAGRRLAPDKFNEMISHIVREKGQVNLNYLVNQCNITVRQFERKFKDRIGIPPKLFIKKTRLNHVIELRSLHPDWSWTELTYEAGYFDQAHMIRDFKHFTAESPGRFVKKLLTKDVDEC